MHPMHLWCVFDLLGCLPLLNICCLFCIFGATISSLCNQVQSLIQNSLARTLIPCAIEQYNSLINCICAKFPGSRNFVNSILPRDDELDDHRYFLNIELIKLCKQLSAEPAMTGSAIDWKFYGRGGLLLTRHGYRLFATEVDTIITKAFAPVEKVKYPQWMCMPL